MSVYTHLVDALMNPGNVPDYTTGTFTYRDVAWDLGCSYEYARSMVLRAVDEGLVSITRDEKGSVTCEKIDRIVAPLQTSNFQDRLLSMVKNKVTVDLSEVTDEALLAEVQRRLIAA